jgi:hypothetical protein
MPAHAPFARGAGQGNRMKGSILLTKRIHPPAPGGQFGHFLPEGAKESSPGCSPPRRTESGEERQLHFRVPEGRGEILHLCIHDIHAIALGCRRSGVLWS